MTLVQCLVNNQYSRPPTGAEYSNLHEQILSKGIKDLLGTKSLVMGKCWKGMYVIR
jgi:hypothetical protein